MAIPLQPRLIRTMSLVYPREKFRSRLLSTFVEFATPKMREIASRQLCKGVRREAEKQTLHLEFKFLSPEP